MKERPIIFSSWSVPRILDGRKTQTRRPLKPQPRYHERARLWGWRMSKHTSMCIPEPPNECAMGMDKKLFGVPGDRLWVRETWRVIHSETEGNYLQYRAGGQWNPETKDDRLKLALVDGDIDDRRCEPGWTENMTRWRPSIHMPRWASRITLLVKRVWVERLQDITVPDVVAEGMHSCVMREFAALWDSIYGKASPWSSNPWVGCCEFELLTGVEP